MRTSTTTNRALVSILLFISLAACAPAHHKAIVPSSGQSLVLVTQRLVTYGHAHGHTLTIQTAEPMSGFTINDGSLAVKFFHLVTSDETGTVTDFVVAMETGSDGTVTVRFIQQGQILP